MTRRGIGRLPFSQELMRRRKVEIGDAVLKAPQLRRRQALRAEPRAQGVERIGSAEVLLAQQHQQFGKARRRLLWRRHVRHDRRFSWGTSLRQHRLRQLAQLAERIPQGLQLRAEFGRWESLSKLG